jgi:ribosome biogenesis protein Nip4
MATPIARKQLVAIGTCFGKFTGSGVFLLHITCLDYLAQFAKVSSQFTLKFYRRYRGSIDAVFVRPRHE